jgi:hypothetical protein
MPSCIADHAHDREVGASCRLQTIDDPSEEDGRAVNSKFLAIVLDFPHCAPDGKTATLIEAISVSRKWLGQHVAIVGDMVLDRRFYLDAHDAVTRAPGEMPNNKFDI